MRARLEAIWKLHGDGRGVADGTVVLPEERLRAPAMLGLGAQHVLAMFGSTALVAVLTGFPVSTTLLFSGVGTLLFCVITGNRVPSYTGSSFAFIAPLVAAKAQGGIPVALRGLAGQLSVFLGVIAGYAFAGLLGRVDWSGVHADDWVGLPDFTARRSRPGRSC